MSSVNTTERSGVPWRLVGWVVAVAFFVIAAVGLLALPVDWALLLKTTRWGLVVVSLLVLALGQAIRGMMGWASGRSFAFELRPRASYVYWHLSQVAKYVPGGFWLVPARAVLYADHGMPATVATAAVLWEITTVLMTGIAVALLGGAGFLIEGQALILLALALPLVGAALWSRTVWSLFARRGVKGAGLIAEALSGSWRTRVRVIGLPTLIAVTSWLLIGAAFHILLLSVDPSVGLSWFESAGRYVAAWVAGFLVVFAPAGLGVREATLTLALTPVLGGATALAFSLGSRIWWAIVEALHVLVSVTLRRGVSGVRGEAET